MRRRDLILALAGTAAWPLAARAQQAERTRRVGVLLTTRDITTESGLAIFLQTLQDLGWTAGRNLIVDHRAAGGDIARARILAKELLGLTPEVILAAGIGAVAALREETRTVPIVFTRVSDPIGQGFVADLGRPGGNVTGFINFDVEMGGKWLEILKEVAPDIARVAVIGNPKTSALDGYFRAIAIASSSLGIAPARAPVHNVDEIEQAIAVAAGQPGSGLIVLPDGFMNENRAAVIDLAIKYRLPAIYPFRFLVAEGGLVAYGVDTNEQYRGAASYVDRILRGARPVDLPVQAPTKFELVVNLKAAKAIGLTVPESFLLRADEVIE